MSPRFSIRPLATLADRRLVELAATGDERAFEVLIRRHRVELERYCWRLGLPDHHAEDVLQQAFIRAWVALRRGGNVGQPRAWLYRIVHNAALNAHRSARLRTHESIDAAVEGSLALAPAEDLETRLLAMDALRHVAALPHMQRRAVVMTAIEGRSHEEAAGELGVTDGAVRGLLHRARTKLRAAAAALTPQGLLELLSRSSSGGALAGPPLEVGAGVAGAGFAGVVAKGAAFTAIAGLLAGGAVSQLGPQRRHASPRPPAVAGQARASVASVPAGAWGGLDSGAGTSGRSGREDQHVGRRPGESRRGASGRHGGREGAGSRESTPGRDDAAEPSFDGRRGRDGGLRTRSGGGDGGARGFSVRDGGGNPSSGGSDGSGRHGESTPAGQQADSDGSPDGSGVRTSGRDEPAFVTGSGSGPSLSASGGERTSDGGGSGGSGSSGGLDGSSDSPGPGSGG
jgi:RNA polymerase sigma factor (sigma-70 family)